LKKPPPPGPPPQKLLIKGSHGLPKDSFTRQTMTALIKSFYGGSRGAVFSKRAPLVKKLQLFLGVMRLKGCKV
jgi:hypothetical protein